VRFLLILVVIVAAIYMLRRALMRVNRDAAAPPPPAPGELVSCARCGLHLPRGEAREVGGRLFCSDEHARLGAAPKG